MVVTRTLLAVVVGTSMLGGALLPGAALARTTTVRALPPPMRHVFVGSHLQQNSQVTIGSIVDADFDNLIIRPGEHVRVRCAPACDAKVGDTLFAFSKTTPVINPVTGKKAGLITDATGMLQVTQTEAQGDHLWARVMASVMEIERGQSVAKNIGPLFVDVVPKWPQVARAGHVLAIARNLLLGREERTLFIDLGQQDGLAVGDTLVISGRRDTVHPPVGPDVHKEAMARGVVVTVSERASTVMVVDGLWEVALGDAVVASPPG
jgi:hypothetical protein